jgi:hypothetical protein
MEENIGLVVVEHLSHELRIHIRNVDLLQVLVKHHDSLVEFLLQKHQSSAPLGFMWTYNVDDDAREQLALLVLMRAFLQAGLDA